MYLWPVENVIEKPFTAEQVIEATGIHRAKVRNIFQYGSRVYGTNRLDSDYDVIVIACTMDTHKENYCKIGDKLLNIHVFTPDVFKEALNTHNIMNLECYFLPEHFILLNKQPLELNLNQKALVKNILGQSYNSWHGAKVSFNQSDPVRGTKGAFHAIRMLIFAIQILEHGRITDYAAANHIFKSMSATNEFEWECFKEDFFPLKQELEDKLKNLAK